MVKKFFQKISQSKSSNFEVRCDEFYTELQRKISKAKAEGNKGIVFLIENVDAAVLEVTLFRLKRDGYKILEGDRVRNQIRLTVFFP